MSCILFKFDILREPTDYSDTEYIYYYYQMLSTQMLLFGVVECDSHHSVGNHKFYMINE